MSSFTVDVNIWIHWRSSSKPNKSMKMSSVNKWDVNSPPSVDIFLFHHISLDCVALVNYVWLFSTVVPVFMKPVTTTSLFHHNFVVVVVFLQGAAGKKGVKGEKGQKVLYRFTVGWWVFPLLPTSFHFLFHTCSIFTADKFVLLSFFFFFTSQGGAGERGDKGQVMMWFIFFCNNVTEINTRGVGERLHWSRYTFIRDWWFWPF